MSSGAHLFFGGHLMSVSTQPERSGLSKSTSFHGRSSSIRRWDDRAPGQHSAGEEVYRSTATLVTLMLKVPPKGGASVALSY